MTDFVLQLAETLPALLVIIMVKMPLALFVWRWMLNAFDRRLEIDFKEVYRAWDSHSRALYHSYRALAAAIICAFVFL